MLRRIISYKISKRSNLIQNNKPNNSHLLTKTIQFFYRLLNWQSVISHQKGNYRKIDILYKHPFWIPCLFRSSMQFRIQTIGTIRILPMMFETLINKFFTPGSIIDCPNMSSPVSLFAFGEFLRRTTASIQTKVFTKVHSQGPACRDNKSFWRMTDWRKKLKREKMLRIVKPIFFRPSWAGVIYRAILSRAAYITQTERCKILSPKDIIELESYHISIYFYANW